MLPGTIIFESMLLFEGSLTIAVDGTVDVDSTSPSRDGDVGIEVDIFAPLYYVIIICLPNLFFTFCLRVHPCCTCTC